MDEDGAVMLEPRFSFNAAIVGSSQTEHGDVFVYDYDKLVQVHVDMGMSHDEAVEYTDYNTVRAVMYMGERKPVILMPIEKDDIPI